MKTHKELVTEFAKTWNNLDSSYIQKFLASDFHYSSQWVFDEIQNKNDFLEYLDKKLKSITNSDNTLTAELGIFNNKYCLVLTQVENEVETKVTFLIETKDGKIISVSSCFLPAPEKVKFLGVIPK